MIWLIDIKELHWLDCTLQVKYIAKCNNCTILKTSTTVPQWLQCDEADLILIKIKYPKLIAAIFTEEEFVDKLSHIMDTQITPADILALKLRNNITI